MESTLLIGESQDYQFQVSNIGEEGSTLSYEFSASAFENALGSDNSGNSWSSSDYDINSSWVDIEDVSTPVHFNNNDSADGTIEIGFDFPLYNQYYSECSVNANGWIGFGGDSGAWDNTELPNSDIPGPALFPFWDDLNPTNDQCNQYCSGDVYYYSSPDMFVITFDQVAHWWTNFEDSFYTFQVVMFPSGEFHFNYLSLEGDYDSATIGMQNSNASDALTMASNNSASLIEDNFSIAVKQIPSWIEINNGNGNLSDGQTTNVTVILATANLSVGSYNAYLSINTNATDVSIPVTLTVTGEILLGDINGDGLINIQDIVTIINDYVLEGEYSSIADMNMDGQLNILDVIMLVNIIIN